MSIAYLVNSAWGPRDKKGIRKALAEIFGWAMGRTSSGRQLGMRRGSVEVGAWIPYNGPESTVDAVLNGVV